MDVNANLVKELRDKTGAGMMDCKKALAEANGDLEKAVVWLREKGIARPPSAPAGSHRKARSVRYIHAGGKLGVLVEVNCESDFCRQVATAFQTLVKEIAMQVAAANPRVVKREDLSADVIEQERQIYASQAEGKPEAVVAKSSMARSRSSTRTSACSNRPGCAIPTRPSTI